MPNNPDKLLKSRSRRKKHYFQQLIDEPVFVGKTPRNAERPHGVSYRKPFYVATFFWLCTLLTLLPVMAGILYFYQKQSLKSFKLLGLAIILHLGTVFICFLARKAARCTLCRAHTLVDGKSRKHDKAYKIRPFSYASTSCLTILTSNRFRCQHCGTSFIVKPNRKK